MDDIHGMLEKLFELRTAMSEAALAEQAEIDAATPPEVFAAIAEIRGRYNGTMNAVAAQAEVLEAEIKRVVILAGGSVKSPHMQAVYAKGKTTWRGNDTLAALAEILPQVAAARTVGEPTVSIRKV